ncbi:adenylate/guanylate cyclase domain-containing protein [Mangrovihabitans endophyticus]|uniref:Guanylate cyclase domain-containing protein n=1 Tax=Mangrovihabitans endophyticus TaxID=1751298 RepID=A0A8J3BWS2_9ACTN|nr:adenylate/guanylate cyclase domain-containing protein [Mangrovihabitans endophyticus]GGK84525.1 hypothetical protein GCM10012284_18470 [Mangrovihabitans endophyticus]
MVGTATRVRRQTVTVLFVDIVGFTGLIDELDCAEVRDLQVDYFAAVSQVIRECGGVVEKYVGDAVMAVFGVAGAAGAAEAAVQAGLLVQEALRGRALAGRHTVHTRVGVATGDVMVDPDAVRDGGQAMISGRVVSAASRLQSCAPEDTVVVCAATRAATDREVAYQEMPPMAPAGCRRPMEVSRALHPQGVLC